MNSTNNKLRRDESQRDSIIQPGIARYEQPWVCRTTDHNPEGVESVRVRSRCNPVEVGNYESWTMMPPEVELTY